MNPDRIVATLRAANRVVGYAIGFLLMAVAAFILLEIVLRQTGGVLGGSDEISGYMTAIVASWGFAYALSEQTHVRIDLAQRLAPAPGRAALDCLALVTTAVVALVVTWYGWEVLSKTIESGARANTPLETPLWIPQTIWFGGWVWFTANAVALGFASAVMTARGRYAAVEDAFGVRGEVEQ